MSDRNPPRTDASSSIRSGAVPVADAEHIDDFWARAPVLFELASSIGTDLERGEAAAVLDRVRQLADSIPSTPDPLGEMDPYLRSALLTGVIHSLRAAEQADRGELRIMVERVRQALRDILDERPVWCGGPKDAAMWLREQGISANDVAALLSVSPGTVRRWASADDDMSPTGENADKVMVIAKVVNHLRHAMTPRGAMQWLQRPHPALDDRRPIEDVKDPDSYRRLIHLASGARSFVAT